MRYSKRHPDLEFTHFVIPQVPGSVKRSRPVRGVLESVFRAKKYVVVLAAFHPFIAAGVVSVYVVGDRFNPAKNTVVFNLAGDPEAAPTDQERRAYLDNLRTVAADKSGRSERSGDLTWRKFVETSQPQLDAKGQAVLQAPDGENTVELG